MEQRLERVMFELGLENNCDIVVYNDAIETAVESLRGVIY